MLLAKSGRPIGKESPVPIKPVFDLGQELIFTSGNIFTDEPMPSQVVHVHHDNFSVTFFCEDVSVGDVKKYRHRFIARSGHEATPELVEAIEHFFFDAADFVDEEIAIRNKYRRFFQPLIIAREEMKKEEKNKAIDEVYSLLDEIYDLLSDESEDPMESLLSDLGLRRGSMRRVPGFCGIGIEKNPFSHCYGGCFPSMRDSIYGLGERHELDDLLSAFGDPLLGMIVGLGKHAHPVTKNESNAGKKPDPDAATSGDDCPEDGESDHSEDIAPDGDKSVHSEITVPDGDVGEPSGLSSPEDGIH